MVDKIREYILKKYSIKPENPWAKYPDYETYKDKDSDKWFAVIMVVSKRKLGIDSDEEITILNVKAEPEFIGIICASEGYMPGYHMNKRSWLTVFLDGTVSFEQIVARIDDSYELVSNTPTKRIYEAVKKIPRGKVATYGKVAEMAGDRKMARAVGNALHKNNDPENVPCYRVVNSKGELAQVFVFGGVNVQAEMLMKDGIEVVDGKVDLKKYGL